MKKSFTASLAFGAATLLLLTSCAGNADSGATTDPASGATGASDSEFGVTIDENAAALLPKDIQDAGVIIAATAVGYEPYEYKDDNGEFAGLDIDLGNAIGDALGVKVEFQDASYDSITGAVKSGRYDVSLTGYTASVEKQAQNDLIAYAKSELSILVPAGNPLGIDGLSGLCGTRVGVEKGSSADLAIGDYIAAGSCDVPIDFTAFPVQADAVTALQSDRIDAVVVQSVSGNYVANSLERTKDSFDLVTDDAFPATTIAMIVDKAQPDLRDAIVAALLSLQENGTFSKIFEKYGVEAAAVTGAALNPAK